MTEQASPMNTMLLPKGEARIVTTDGQTVTLHAAFPAPPGCPLDGNLKDTPHRLQVKVHGSRAMTLSDGQPGFEIRGRWVSLSREARTLLTTPPVLAAKTDE
jgi:hypothetical protein